MTRDVESYVFKTHAATILRVLATAQRELTLTELTQLTKLSASTVKYHLYNLERANLVEVSRRGGCIYVKITDFGLKIVQKLDKV